MSWQIVTLLGICSRWLLFIHGKHLCDLHGEAKSYSALSQMGLTTRHSATLEPGVEIKEGHGCPGTKNVIYWPTCIIQGLKQIITKWHSWESYSGGLSGQCEWSHSHFSCETGKRETAWDNWLGVSRYAVRKVEQQSCESIWLGEPEDLCNMSSFLRVLLLSLRGNPMKDKIFCFYRMWVRVIWAWKRRLTIKSGECRRNLSFRAFNTQFRCLLKAPLRLVRGFRVFLSVVSAPWVLVLPWININIYWAFTLWQTVS